MSSEEQAWRSRVHHILDAARQIRAHAENMSYERFCGDQKTIHAVAWNFMIIGEASRHIPPELELSHPEIPWAQMRGMRNILVHEYDWFDMEVVWDAIHNDLVPLIYSLSALLEEEPE